SDHSSRHIIHPNGLAKYRLVLAVAHLPQTVPKNDDLWCVRHFIRCSKVASDDRANADDRERIRGEPAGGVDFRYRHIIRNIGLKRTRRAEFLKVFRLSPPVQKVRL